MRSACSPLPAQPITTKAGSESSSDFSPSRKICW